MVLWRLPVGTGSTLWGPSQTPRMSGIPGYPSGAESEKNKNTGHEDNFKGCTDTHYPRMINTDYRSLLKR